MPRKKHLSTEAVRKIAHKQTMYTNHQDAFNAAMTKIRIAKRSYEQKCACNIKTNDSKSFMHIQ